MMYIAVFLLSILNSLGLFISYPSIFANFFSKGKNHYT